MIRIPPYDKVLLQEVGPRDGLQNESLVLTPRQRADVIESLGDAGLSRIQIGSFVNPRRVPQMAGTDLVWDCISPLPAVRYSVLVLNPRGLEQAIACGVPHVEIYVSASETHSLKNSGATVADALQQAVVMISRAKAAGLGVTAGVMCAFGCFYEGAVSVEKVVQLVNAFCESDPAEIGLADTAGMGKPDQVRLIVEAVGKTVEVSRLGIHLHDTRGQGLANLAALLEMGVRRFDTSVGGLGGCPFIPGAVGNISTERTVEMVESMGFETGVDNLKVRKIAKDLGMLLGRRLDG